jgi:hypothetical protein
MAERVAAKGVDRQVVFDGATVTFHPDGFARLRARVKGGDRGPRVIPIEEILAVELVPSSFALNGYVRFTLATDDPEADDPRASAPNPVAAAKRAARDPNVVMFSRYQAAAFRELHEAIVGAIDRRTPE